MDWIEANGASLRYDSGHFMAVETPDLLVDLAIPFLTAGAAGAR